MAQGDFAIDSTLIGTEYSVVAWTNYMHNFKELTSFRQQIKVFRHGMETNSTDADMKVTVYPEGGNVIAGAYNNIGILVDNGLGQGVSIDNLELVDGSGKVVRSKITTNDFGIGKVGFLAEPQKSYVLQRKRPDGSLVGTAIPEAVEGQLGLTVDNNGRDKVLFTLLAAKETLFKRDGDILTMALYQDDFIRFDDFEVDEDEVVLSIKRGELPFGILTAVLFNKELRPIAHRMFFNHRKDAKRLLEVEVDHCLTALGDSIQVDLILPEGFKDEVNLSLSALPGRSSAYRPDHSVASSFLIGPYIEQYHQDHYFFENQDRRKRYELDKRLIIEGWGRYHWDSRKQEEVAIAFEMETGIPFEGRIVDADLNEEFQVSLIAERSSAMGFEELDANKTFEGNMELFEGDSLGISLIGKNGKLRKPIAELSLQKNRSFSLKNKRFLEGKTLKRQVRSIEDYVEIDQSLNIGERIIALDEVIVTENVVRNNKYQFSDQIEGRAVGDLEIKRYRSVRAYLRKLGFIISVNSDGFGITARSPRFPNLVAPIIINGMETLSGEVLTMPLSSIRFLTYRKDGNKPFISMTLNPNYTPPNQRNKFMKFAIENGYARPQEYFAPNYPGYNSNVFQAYGALDWRATISVNSDMPTSISIPTKNQKGIQLYIEGMDSEGRLLSQRELMEVN